MSDIYRSYQQHVIGKNTYAKTADRHYEDMPSAGFNGISDQYIILDSFMKERDSDTRSGEFRWTFAVQSATKNNMIGVTDKLNDIIEIQVDKFHVPIPEDVKYEVIPSDTAAYGLDRLFLFGPDGTTDAPLLDPIFYPNTLQTTPWIHNPYSQTPYSGCFTMQIREFGRQAYSSAGGVFHQFEFNTSVPRSFKTAPNILLADPINDKFIFTEPFRNLESMSVIFRNPDYPINFAPDTIYDAQIEECDYGGIACIRIVVENHGLLVGDRIFIKEANTGSSTINKHLIRHSGHIVMDDLSEDNGSVTAAIGTAINTPNSFMINPIISTADCRPDTVIKSYLIVQIAKRRIRIPMKIRRLVPHLTNHITI